MNDISDLCDVTLRIYSPAPPIPFRLGNFAFFFPFEEGRLGDIEHPADVVGSIVIGVCQIRDSFLQKKYFHDFLLFI